MRFRRLLIIECIALALIVTVAMNGCGSNATLPSTVVIELPDGTIVEVGEGAGVMSLADSSWQFVRQSDGGPDEPFVTAVFGPEGNLIAFEDNTIAQNMLGSTVLFDGERHATSTASLEYAATTYGAATDDGTGIAFEGRFTAFYGGIKVGEGEATALAVFDPNDPNLMAGTFEFSMQVTLPFEVEGADQEDSFAFVAYRVIEE